MSEKKSALKIPIQVLSGLVALFLLYLLSSAVFTPPEPRSHKGSNYNGIDYTIRIYYFPAREAAANAMAEYFSNEQYRIEILPALNEPTLQDKRYGTSYLYFNNADVNQALQIKRKLEQVVGFPINGYRRSEPIVNPSMMFVLTDKRAS
ncbi:MAG: hypothetical protein ACPG4U_00590 [Pseudomonadales bacterium]